MTKSSIVSDIVPLPVIRRTPAPLREQVVDELRDAIISGRLEPGTRLLERELLDMLGVSRTVVREALRQIQSEGLIAEDPKRGVVVRELSVTEASHLYAIRALLEGLAARLFVQSADDAQIARLAQALAATVEAYQRGDPAGILAAKNHFYQRLYEGAASETLCSMLEILHARISRWRALGLSHPQRSRARSAESVRGLRALLAAIRKRDAQLAETIMRDETSKAAAEVMRLLAFKQPAAPAKR